MPTFGKVLAIVNFLLALAFVWVLTLDYSKRNAISFQILQDDFILKGLPVDKTEKDAEDQFRVDLVGTEMKKGLFTGIQGQPVTTQTDEVNQRHNNLVSEITAEQAADTKKKRLQEILIPLARNAVERTNLVEQIRTAKSADLGADGALLGKDSLFETMFQEALGTGKNMALENRRATIAHFLFCVSTKEEDFKRTLAVVGAEAYSREIEGQTSTLRGMVPAFEAAIAGDRAAFIKEHHALIQDILLWAQRNQQLQDDLTRQEAQREQYSVLVKARETDKSDLETRIKSARAASEQALADQGKLEDLLFTAQKTIAAVSAANQRLEKDIKSRENGQ